jgi:crotonobetainyl-CoA:carnitine CoA-transferase CaiB-like acyl-CoA transferase
MVTIHDVSIDEVIVREMNDEEYAEWQARVAENEALIATLAAKEAAEEAAKEAAEAKLAALGLTTDDLKALGL